MKRKIIKSWLLAIGYVAFIYCTLSLVRTPITYLRENDLLVFSLRFITILFFGGLAFYLVRHKLYEPWRMALILLISLVYFLIVRHIPFPEEKIHFYEYGFVGVLFLQALKHHLGYQIWTYALAFVLASLAGWLDEIIQGVLPTRMYDIRDIYLNSISAFLGLAVFATFHFQPHKANSSKIT